MLHPSASSRSRSWTAGSPHFPFSQQPPPPPSHLSPPPWSSTSFTQHFQHSSENGQGFNARFNIVPNRPAPSIPHFSKPVRFPVQDNDDFVPMFGQGIRLPKPSPGILITPTSNEHNQNIKPSNVFKEFVPSEKQPDNYVFFNLESSPHVYNGVNRTIPTINNNFNHNISHYSSAHSTVLGNNTYRGNTFNSNQNNFSPTRNPPTGNSLQTVQNFRDNTSYRPNFDSTENSLENTEKSNPNLIASASYSEETQVSPPSNSEESNWNEDKPDYTYEPLGFDEDRSNSNYDEATKSSPYSSNADNTEEDSTTHSYEEKEGEDTTEHSGESQEESRYVDQNDHESNDFNETSVESHISDFPSPPKEFFEKPDLNNKHYYNPFSNPEFDYDKYIDELSDHKINQDKKETVHQDKETYEINQQRLSLNRHRTKPRKEKNHHSEQIYNIDSESNEKLSKVHPGLMRGIQYQPLPEAAPRILRNRVRAKPQDNRSGYQKHPTINQQKHVSHTGNSKINKMPFKNGQYSRSKSGSKRNRHSPVHLINTDDDNDQNDRGGSTIPSNRLSGSYNNKPNKNILTSLSDHESQKKFKENENINTDSEYLSPNGQPSLYSVHKQNSESDLPHQEQTKSKEKDAYDDEDYYDSNEDAEYYDDYSLENTPSLLNKQIKPPKAPKRITNIENMSFDKPDADEDYDDVSAEETDDEDKTSNKDSHIQAHVADCNKKYKNHKCNVDDSEENDYKEGKPENSEEYSADEDEEEDEDTENNNNRSNQYEVVEDAAESQHHMRKTAMNNKQMANLFPNNYSKNGSLNMSNKSNMNVPSINQLNGFNLNLSTNNKANNKSFQIPFSLSGKNVSNTFSKDILLKALSADQGLSSRSKNTLSNNSLNSLHRFITFPKIINKPNKTVTYLNNNKSVVNSDLVNKSNRSSQMTVDNTKLHFSSTSPLNPKPLKYLKQRPVTKPTDVTAAGDFETREPMTQLNMDSHLTNSVTAAGRQSIQPASYVEPTTTQRVTSRGYNTTQHQQYTPSPYDPYYNIYEDDTDLYKDIDYSQYSGQQYQAQPAYKEKQSQVPQQQVQSTPSRKPSVQYSPPPPPPPQQSYNAVQQDVYSQAVSAQDYNDNYNLQDEDIDYKQSDIDLKGNRGGGRTRGSATYTVSPNEAEPSPTPNRGTPSSIGRNRPTLKPSTSIVSKASEFIDIYRYPPSRPEPIYPTPQVDKTAAKCRKDVCLLPDCSCGGKEIPGELTPEQTPQIVLLTFDDSVNDLNKGLYSDLFEKGRTNPNGCPISATFYVSHEWTDYSQVQNLYASGHEMASHSVSHSFGEQFSVKKWTKEIAGQREILSAYGGVRQEDIRGMRAPFLSIGGNKMFKMLYDSNFTYDSSMPVYENKPPSWPYTLDYKIFHDCMIPPCPTRSYPGVWEVPMVMWQDLNGGRCSMGDACSNPPTSDGVYKMLIKNFERHFTSNRAPFGLFYHAAWFTQPHHKEGFIAFLDAITKMPEVWVITNWQAIQWVRDPTPISRLNNFAPFQCNYPERPRRCNNPKVCNLWHKSGVRYMRTCQPCPEIYPWTGKSGVRNSRVDNEIITE